MLAIQVRFDLVCPWCYIGKVRLERAVATVEPFMESISWLPFLLNPGMPRAGIGRQAYLEWKFGGKQGAKTAYAPVMEAMRTEGLEFNPEKILRTPCTVDAHRLIGWAVQEGIDASRLIDRIFEAYFCCGRDIGDILTLVEIWGGLRP